MMSAMTPGNSAGREERAYDADGGAGGAGLDPDPSAVRLSGCGAAGHQLDLRPRGDLDPAGGGAAVLEKTPVDGGVGVLPSTPPHWNDQWGLFFSDEINIK